MNKRSLIAIGVVGLLVWFGTRAHATPVDTRQPIDPYGPEPKPVKVTPPATAPSGSWGPFGTDEEAETAGGTAASWWDGALGTLDL